MNYSEVKQAAARIKQEFPVLDYFHSLVRSGFLKFEGIHGKEYFFGFLEQRTAETLSQQSRNLKTKPSSNQWKASLDQFR